MVGCTLRLHFTCLANTRDLCTRRVLLCGALWVSLLTLWWIFASSFSSATYAASLRLAGDSVIAGDDDHHGENDASNETLIVYWTPFFDKTLYPEPVVRRCHRRGHDLPPLADATTTDGDHSLTCRFTSSRESVERAQAVVFHARDLKVSEMPRVKPDGTVWVYFTLENPIFDWRACGWFTRVIPNDRHCDKVGLDPELLGMFELRRGYQLDADVVTPYVRRSMKELTDAPPLQPFAHKRNAVVWWARNCDSINKRERYIAELMKHYPVHSYGDCLNNMRYRRNASIDHQAASPPASDDEVLALVSQYKFALAWENANCQDYVTEKLVRVFAAGVLPIVDGPEDYSPFVPSPRSVIRVDAFDGPKALADYLRRLERDDDLYRSHFDYKLHHHNSNVSISVSGSEGGGGEANRSTAYLAYETGGESDECQMCRKVAEELEKPRSARRRVQVDRSCTRRKWDRVYGADGSMSAEPIVWWIEWEWGFGAENYALWGMTAAALAAASALTLWLLRARRRQCSQRQIAR